MLWGLAQGGFSQRLPRVSQLVLLWQKVFPGFFMFNVWSFSWQQKLCTSRSDCVCCSTCRLFDLTRVRFPRILSIGQPDLLCACQTHNIVHTRLTASAFPYTATKCSQIDAASLLAMFSWGKPGVNMNPLFFPRVTLQNKFTQWTQHPSCAVSGWGMGAATEKQQQKTKANWSRSTCSQLLIFKLSLFFSHWTDVNFTHALQASGSHSLNTPRQHTTYPHIFPHVELRTTQSKATSVRVEDGSNKGCTDGCCHGDGCQGWRWVCHQGRVPGVWELVDNWTLTFGGYLVSNPVALSLSPHKQWSCAQCCFCVHPTTESISIVQRYEQFWQLLMTGPRNTKRHETCSGDVVILSPFPGFHEEISAADRGHPRTGQGQRTAVQGHWWAGRGHSRAGQGHPQPREGHPGSSENHRWTSVKLQPEPARYKGKWPKAMKMNILFQLHHK